MNARAAKPAGKQRGTLIIALMAGIAIVMILSTVAVQNWSDVVRRDNEAEMMFRAQDIVRALKRFQADKGKLPNDLKELMEPGQKGQYFLRRLWKDPLVKGGKWQLLYAAPGGGLFDPTVPNANPQQGGGLQGAGLQGAGLQGAGTQASSGAGVAFPPLGGRLGADGGAPGEGMGLPIAGVKTLCKDDPFRRYKDKESYNEWVFSIFEMDQRQPSPVGGQQNQSTFPPQSPPQSPPPGQAPPTEVK